MDVDNLWVYSDRNALSGRAMGVVLVAGALATPKKTVSYNCSALADDRQARRRLFDLTER